MSLVTARRLLALTAVALALSSLGCPPPDTKYKAAETRKGPAVSKEAIPGGEFNKFFPKPGGEYDIVYDQEKPGIAKASLKKGGTVVADLSIFDTVSNPEAVAEYKDSTAKIDKHPKRDIGKNATAILVADRFQVQVRSDVDANPPVTKDQRDEWFKKFDLAGLEGLVK